MRYIYRFLEVFPPTEDSVHCGTGLKFLAAKQMLSLLQSLKLALTGENVFNFDAWDQFVASEEKVKYYNQVLSQYGARYEKNKKQLEEQMNTVKKDRKLASVCDANFSRSELLSLLAIKYSIQECKNVWADLCKLENKCTDE